MTEGLLLRLLLALFCCSRVVGGEDYLKEKPDYLHTCERKQPDFNECFKQILANIYTTWKSGVPGVQTTASIDPLIVDKFEVIEEGATAPIVAHLSNITVTGLNQVTIQNVSTNSKDYNFKMTFAVPLVRLEGSYSAKAKILMFQLDAKGGVFMECIDGIYTIAAKIRLRQQDEFKFFDLKSLRFNVKDMKKVRFYFSNLFEDKALNDNTNALFNESWQQLFEVYREPIEKEIKDVYFKHFKYIFNSVPANFLVADVENDGAAQS